MIKILAFSGSAREESLNQKLVKIAAQGAQQHGAHVTIVNLKDYPMPLFNEDLEAEQGLPESVKSFKTLLKEHDGFLIASPEYNSAFSPLLKNAIDWCSRAQDTDEPPLDVYRGKVAAIMAVSPGALGGLRGLVFLRMLLENIGIVVLPTQQAVPKGFQAFSEEGELVDEKRQKAILMLGQKLAELTSKLTA